jgi:DNA-binding MarR family transcriptional regulator
MTSLLDRLVKRGLVLRERPPSNRRAVAITLTTDGAALWQAILTQDYRNMASMLDALDEQDRIPFMRSIATIATRMRSMK